MMLQLKVQVDLPYGRGSARGAVPFWLLKKKSERIVDWPGCRAISR